MNPRLVKISTEIDKTKVKIVTLQSRLKDLERQKTEIENAGILAMVRDIDLSPDELSELVRQFKEKQNFAIPDISATHNDEKEEDSTLEK